MGTMPLAVVVPITPDTVNSANAVAHILRDRWPGAAIAEIRSIDAPSIEGVDASFTAESFSGEFEPRSLIPDDQIALARPAALKELLTSYEVVIWCGSGGLPTSPADEWPTAPATVAALASVQPAHSLTPLLVATGNERDATAVPLVMVLRSGAEDFLDEWSAVCHEAVVEIDQRTVTYHSDSFVARSAITNKIRIDGERLLMSWIDYAAVQSGRAAGREVPFVVAHELFAMERELRMADERPEVEWEMLVHRVHDSRPIEFLRDAIVQAPWRDLRVSGAVDRFVSDARRAADPFGYRWAGEGSDEEFRSWLVETNQFGITRASEMIIRTMELWWEFPKARYAPEAFHVWLDDEGCEKIGFDPRTLEPMPIVLDAAEPDEQSGPIAWRWHILKGLVPGSSARNIQKSFEKIVGKDPAQKRGVAAPKAIEVVRPSSMWGSAPRPLSLIGCVRSESGLGQAARASLQALRLMDRPFTYVDTSEKYPSRNSAETGLDWSTYGNIGDVNLIHSNADEMITMAGNTYRHRFGGRFNAAMWFWETADLPQRSQPAFDVVDELWVASDYLVDVFGQYAQVPVHNIGLASDLPSFRAADRSKLGWREDEFVFLFVYDALSSYGRKNPGKALEAFINAFSPNFEGVRFVLKVSNLNKFPASQLEILALQKKYPSISVIDEYLTRDGVLDLMAAADVYISLHAAEGYGLTLLEAMALGTPTVCTGYSGNMDFTTEQNSWLVDYTMIATDEQTGPYPAGSIWASPNVDSATDLLRYTAEHRDEVERKAKQARIDALDAASLENYAARLDAQLRRVGV